jgi:hypothetical protein
MGGADRGREGGAQFCAVRIGWVDGHGQNHRYGNIPHESDSLPSQSPLVSKAAATTDASKLAPLGAARHLEDQRLAPPNDPIRRARLANGLGQHVGSDLVHHNTNGTPRARLLDIPRGLPCGVARHALRRQLLRPISRA